MSGADTGFLPGEGAQYDGLVLDAIEWSILNGVSTFKGWAPALAPPTGSALECISNFLL